MMKTMLSLLFASGLLLISCKENNNTNKTVKQTEKTVFQTVQPWKPTIDVRSDVAIIYGVRGNPSDEKQSMTFEERVQSWRDKGYKTHFMTGIAWGEYQDYFTGEWDGETHFDEGQVEQNGDTIWHGPMVPYIVPTANFLKYIKEAHIKRVIDAGIDAIYLEEPEFWTRAGYSEAFKQEWKKHYGFDWRAPHESAENTYLSNKLKYQLYYNALDEVFTYAKAYGKSKGMDIRCYVPTHSLINYSQWEIVSPEASLASLESIDGYIAQVWTGTSRAPNYFNGTVKERVFETAFLEYGSMESMTSPTGRKIFFLTDPIEDRPRDWSDFKENYEATFTAQLLYPQIENYEVMPWPRRIYEGLYQKSADSDEKERIPRFYSTQIQVMINTLNNMPESDNRVNGSNGVSVLMANSMMFQHYAANEDYQDPNLSNFYGLAMPFLKRGVPVNITHIENTSYPESLKNTKVLMMSYSNMKPLSAQPHTHIAEWVKEGGVLVYSGKDKDPFQSVEEWWNTNNYNYNSPSEHLFEQMDMIANPTEGEYRYGVGTVYVIRKDPKEYVLEKDKDQDFVEKVKTLYEQRTNGGLMEFKNNFYLERGPYNIVSVMDESVSNEPYVAEGLFIDLFNPQLPILTKKKVLPGQQAFLFNIGSVVEKQKPQVLASASRVYNEQIKKSSYSFVAKSPIETTNTMRILLPSEPKKLSITNHLKQKLVNYKSEWDETSKTHWLEFENSPDGIVVEIKW